MSRWQGPQTLSFTVDTLSHKRPGNRDHRLPAGSLLPWFCMEQTTRVWTRCPEMLGRAFPFIDGCGDLKFHSKIHFPQHSLPFKWNSNYPKILDSNPDPPLQERNCWEKSFTLDSRGWQPQQTWQICLGRSLTRLLLCICFHLFLSFVCFRNIEEDTSHKKSDFYLGLPCYLKMQKVKIKEKGSRRSREIKLNTSTSSRMGQGCNEVSHCYRCWNPLQELCFKLPPLHSQSNTVLMSLRQQREMAQVCGPLSPTGHAWVSLLKSWPCPGQVLAITAISVVSQQIQDSLSCELSCLLNS